MIASIEMHADREFTPEVLAPVGCVNVRTVHAAFHDELGESPMAPGLGFPSAPPELRATAEENHRV